MSAAKWADQNQAIIDEFRANDGVVGGYFTGVPIALVHHKGAKSGVDRINPLATQKLERGYAVFASKGGADDNPAWYYNLLANPDTTVEVGTETVAVRAREAEAVLEGSKLDAATIARAAEGGGQEVEPYTDAVASEWYRRKMVGVYVSRALKQIAGEEE